MIKRIETFLANIFRREIAPLKKDVTAALAAVAALRGELAVLHTRVEETKTHAESVASELHESITNHTTIALTELHDKVTADAKAIALARQSTRMGCSLCGQMTWKYQVQPGSAKVVCIDCAKKSEEAA